MQDSCYLDHNASTALDPRVLEAMLPALGSVFANPSSVYRSGRQARHLLEQARSSIAHALGAAPSEIVLTGSGSEANNTAFFGSLGHSPPAERKRILLSAVEHPSVRELGPVLAARGWQVEFLPVDTSGRVYLEEALELLDQDVALLSVMLANNEVGTLQPVVTLGQRARELGIVVHCDAIQALGKVPFQVHDLHVDLLSISAHKIYGPKGVGALWVREGLELSALVVGGPQEDRRRAGTENLAGILGFARACELFGHPTPEQLKSWQERRFRFLESLRGILPEAQVYGHPTESLHNTVCLSLPHLQGDELLVLLDLEGFELSTGSACSSGSMRPSSVLLAMGLTPDEARRCIRISWGPESKDEALEAFLMALARIARS